MPLLLAIGVSGVIDAAGISGSDTVVAPAIALAAARVVEFRL